MKSGKIEKLVDDTLNSIDDLHTISPDDYIFYGIMNEANKNENFLKEKNSTGKYIFAATMIILLNIITLIGFNNNVTKESTPGQSYSENLNEFTKDYLSVQDEYNYNNK